MLRSSSKWRLLVAQIAEEGEGERDWDERCIENVLATAKTSEQAHMPSDGGLGYRLASKFRRSPAIISTFPPLDER